MAAIIVSLALSVGMLAVIFVGLGKRRPAPRRMIGQLSAQERRRLYRQLGIDPAALARRRQSNVIWLDPRIVDKRTDA